MSRSGEPYLFVALLGLVAIGLLSLSSTARYDTDFYEYFIRQSVWAVAGLLLAVAVSHFDYAFWERSAGWCYGLVLVLLVVTLAAGATIRGSRSWLALGPVNVQTSELAKLAVTLLLARFLARRSAAEWSGDYDREVMRRLVWFGLIVGVPVLLVVIQPDMGTAMTFIPILLLALFFGGVPLALLALIFAVIGITGLFTILLLLARLTPEHYHLGVFLARALEDQEVLGQVLGAAIFLLLAAAYLLNVFFPLLELEPGSAGRWRRSRFSVLVWSGYLLLVVLVFAVETSGFAIAHLKGYQQQRLISFVDPTVYPLQGGYNIIQARIAIGSGGLWGKGFRQGTQHALGFLPEAHTDFIFAIWAEEWGFVGVLALLGLCFLLALRAWHIATFARDRFSYYFVLLWSGGLLAQALVNLAMNVGLLPVVGIPLPLVSYGGSSLLVTLLGAGIVLAVWRHRVTFGSPGG